MTTQTPDAAATPTSARTAPGRRFTPRNAVRLAPDAAERQGRVTRLAIEALGASAAILFLNSEHDGLSDRPLPLATASEDGLQSVLGLLEPAAA
jgi:hypothetical protein